MEGGNRKKSSQMKAKEKVIYLNPEEWIKTLWASLMEQFQQDISSALEFRT